MINFQYARANDLADAVRQVAADPTAKFIAGGTNLIDLMKEGVERPSRLIDISRLPLTKVEETADGALRIGALVPNAAALELEGGAIKEGRLALGGVAHKPWRDLEAEAALRGQLATEAAFAHAADLLLRDAKGYAHNAFKIDLARRAIVRTLTQAAHATPQSQSVKKIR